MQSSNAPENLAIGGVLSLCRIEVEDEPADMRPVSKGLPVGWRGEVEKAECVDRM